MHALITIAARRAEKVARLERIYAGLRKAADRFGVVLAGGETAQSPGPLFINIALTGTVERGRCVLRSGGKAGDAIYVTGRLGGSRAGKHLDFTPRLAEAHWLTARFPVRAMMDLSDGLAADLPRLARASRSGFLLDEPAIPRTRGCTLAQALGDGEDYELLFALAPRHSAALELSWRKKFPRLPLTRIGVLNGRSAHSIQPSTPSRGFDHFA
jgi:thiamine-monophosphate kinase